MVTNNIGFIIQARLNSSRLSQKVLLPLPYGSNTCLLDQIIQRTRNSKTTHQVIIATSNNPENDVLAKIANKNKVLFFRGPEGDVLQRFYEAATQFKIDTIVRLTADNPFIDATIIDQALETHITGNYHYTATSGLPLGTNIEIISYPALAQAAQAATLPEQREHVTPYIKQNNNIFRQNIIYYKDAAFGAESWRLTIDNDTDYALACVLYYILYRVNPNFSLYEVATLIRQQPWLTYINRQNIQKRIFNNLTEELQAGIQLLKQNDMLNAASLLADTQNTI